MPSQHVCVYASSREISGEALPPVFGEPFTCVSLLLASEPSPSRLHRRTLLCELPHRACMFLAAGHPAPVG